MKIRFIGLVVLLIGNWLALSSPVSRSAQTTSGCAVVRGRVVDESGTPVSGVSVYAMIQDRPPRARSADVRTATDQNGDFSLSCVEAGNNSIHFAKESDFYPDTLLASFGDPKRIPVVNVSAGQTINGIEIRLGPKAGRLTGQVVDAATKKRIEGATLTICRADRKNDCRKLSANQSPEGFSHLLPAVALTVRGSAPGYAEGIAQPIQIKPSATKTLTVSLRRR